MTVALAGLRCMSGTPQITAEILGQKAGMLRQPPRAEANLRPAQTKRRVSISSSQTLLRALPDPPLPLLTNAPIRLTKPSHEPVQPHHSTNLGKEPIA